MPIYAACDRVLALAARTLEVTSEAGGDPDTLDDVFDAVTTEIAELRKETVNLPIRDAALAVLVTTRETAAAAFLESTAAARRAWTRSKRQTLTRDCELLRTLLGKDLQSG